MKCFDLIFTYGNKANDKQVFQLLSGKNSIGSNIKCSTQIDRDLIKPQHFEILVAKTGRLTLIPLVSGLQLKSKTTSNKLKELEPYQCYDLNIKQQFYVERTYSCQINETPTKKKSNSNDLPFISNSLWQPNRKGIAELFQHHQQQEQKNKQEIKNILELELYQTDSTQFSSEEYHNNNSKKIKTEINTKSKQIEQEDEDIQEELEEQVVVKPKSNKKSQKIQLNSNNKNSKNNSTKNKSVKDSLSSCETSLLLEYNEKKSCSKNIIQCSPPIKNNKESTESMDQNRNKIQQKNVCRVVLSNCELTTSQKNKLESLGIIFEENYLNDFDVVVMDGFRRRAKLLIGLNKRAWILSKNWILDCIDDNELILDFPSYLLEISEEDQMKFDNLDLDTIQSFNQRNKNQQKIFQDDIFYINEKQQEQSKNIPIQDLQQIIVSGGGSFITNYDIIKQNPKIKYYQIVENQNNIQKIKKDKNIIYIDPEYILLSSLKQEIQDQFILKL